MVRSQQPGQIPPQIVESAMGKFQRGDRNPALPDQAQNIVESDLSQGDKPLQILEENDFLFQEWQAVIDLSLSGLILRWRTAASADVQLINLNPSSAQPTAAGWQNPPGIAPDIEIPLSHPR
jgi:hypothetical protein